jgi:quinoprotein glucose dehydrogenase
MNFSPLKYLFPCLLVITFSCQNKIGSRDWPAYGGNKAGNRFSSLQQINRDNVEKLKLAWTYDTGDNNDSTRDGTDMQCQPIVVNGVLYAVTPRMKLFALDAASGKQIWIFDPFSDGATRKSIHAVRGIVYWEDGDDKRILYSVGTSIYAVNAITGEKIESFGHGGRVDMRIGLRDNEAFDTARYSMRSTSPGAVYKDILIMGSSVSEGPDAPPGYIQAFNVRTGELAWVFHTIPLPGEYGYETWPPDAYKKIGAANCWSGITIDEKRGIAFVSTGSPSVDFYGGARKGQNLFANCVLALDALTGKRLWHYQTVHHDLWDRDLPCPPNLITVKHNGRDVDAVAQPTKDGLLFLLDRETGQPLFPVNEVPVPTSPALPGESPWPTQPVPVKPAPFSMQEVTEENLTDRTITANAYARGRYRISEHGSKYLPPNEKGTLYLGFGGGAEWGGTAADSNGILYVNSNNMLWWLKMSDASKALEMAATPGARLFNVNCVSCHGANGAGASGGDGAQAYPVLTDVGKRLSRQQISAIIETGRGRMPSFQNVPKNERDLIVDYLLHTEKNVRANSRTHFENYNYSPPYVHNGMVQFRDNDGYPAVKPPWGVLNAIDLNTGDYVWQVPLGEYPALAQQGVAPTGTENHGGPLVTASGLLFIAATYDGHLRAFDTKTGKVIWQYKLPAGAFATPVTYMVNGKQFIAIACGGTRYGLPAGDSYIALSLPD